MSFHTGCAAGSLVPASVVQEAGVDAVFLCQHLTYSGTIEWIINGTALRNIDTSTHGFIRSEGRAAIKALIITAVPQYNNTAIVCLRIKGGAVTLETSPIAMLIVQGIHMKALLT